MLPESDDCVHITRWLRIDMTELSFRHARSGGPGGQNVNKVNTRVTLLFDLDASQSLGLSQKTRIRERLASRINSVGVLRVVSSRHRTQAANRRAAIERFALLLADALTEDKPRKKTRTPASVKRKRREDKAHRSKLKQNRQAPSSDSW